MNTPASDLQYIVEKAASLRRLAGALVREPADADDLAQATAVAAIEHRPDGERPILGWLATVLRRFRLQTHRSQQRRENRERSVATPESVPSASDLADRLETHERVLAAVKSLDEPFRSTVLLRFFEGLEPEEIATKMNVPASTVRTRLHRAMSRLRARLEADYGENGRSWRCAILLIAPRAAPCFSYLATSIGIMLMNAKIVTGVAGLLVAGAASFFFLSNDGSNEPVREPPYATGPVAVPLVPPSDLSGPERVAVDSKRDPNYAAPESPSESSAVAAGRGDVLVTGRVLDYLGSPMAGVKVQGTIGYSNVGDAILAVSGAEGRFELRAAATIGTVVTIDPGLVTLFSGHPGAHGAAEVVLIVAPAVAFKGRVTNDEQAPIVDATVEIQLPARLRSRFDTVLDASEPESFKTSCDKNGVFSFERVPKIGGATVTTLAAGYQPDLQPVPSNDEKLEIVLHRRRPAGTAVSGQVVDSAGALVSDALVSLRGETTRSDAQGRFMLQIGDVKSNYDLSLQVGKEQVEAFGARIMALKAGYLPGVFEAPLTPKGPEFPDFVVLQLGNEALTITGRVEDADGLPIGRAQVWIADPSFFAFDSKQEPLLLENVLAGEQVEVWRPVNAGADGRFVIDGLADRSYKVVAMENVSVASVVAEHVPAGSQGLVLRIPSRELHPRVAGRVVTRDGRGVANASIRASRDVFSRSGGIWSATGASTTTDAEGHFELKDVPKEGVYLRVNGDGITGVDVGVAAGHLADAAPDVTAIRIEVLCEVHLRVELTDPARADAFSLFDANGKKVMIDEVSPGGRWSHVRQKLVDGKSGVFIACETAATIALLKDGVEVERSAIAFERDGVTTIRK